MTALPAGLKVTFWGTRGAIACPGIDTARHGGNTPCVTVAYGNGLLILDAGTGIRALGLKIAADAKAAGQPPPPLHLLLSHTHWDHIQGLPFFTPAYTKGAALTIHGSATKGRVLKAILSGQMDKSYFPVQMDTLTADITIHEFTEDTIVLEGMEVRLQEQILHPGGSVRYRISAGGRTVVYATDIELDAAFAPDTPTERTRQLAAAYGDFIQHADLLIADGQYTETQYADRKGWGHTTIPLLLKVARQHGVRQVAVFHHDPEHDDNTLAAFASHYSAPYRDADPPIQVEWAREGQTVIL